MTIDRSLRKDGTETAVRKLHRHRDHPRFPVEADVELALAGRSAGILVQSKDLSWGGASLLVPQRPLNLDDSVVLRFPWRRGSSFAARAQVVWNHQIDDQHYLGGVSFSKLTVSDEEKLQQLISMLMRATLGTEQDGDAAETLEIRFLDRQEMLMTLEQIRFGSMETTAFKSFSVNERIQLHIAGFSDMPTLRLRARVQWQKALHIDPNPQTPGVFRIALSLDHPIDDLKRVTDPLIRSLNRDHKEGNSALLDRRKKPRPQTPSSTKSRRS